MRQVQCRSRSRQKLRCQGLQGLTGRDHTLQVSSLLPHGRDNPGRQVVLRVERNGQAFDLPMVPELAANDNYGQIGVKLTANAELRHRWLSLLCLLRDHIRSFSRFPAYSYVIFHFTLKALLLPSWCQIRSYYG